METLYKPEKVFQDLQPVPADVEAFLPKLRLICEKHGGLTPLEVDRSIRLVTEYFQRGETRRGRNHLWEATLKVCAWALAHQHRVRGKRAVGWVPMGDMEEQEDIATVRGVYNLLRGCMLQSALVWDESNKVAERIAQAPILQRRGRRCLTLRIVGQKAVLRCAGFTASTDLIRGWGQLQTGVFCAICPPTPLALQQPKPKHPVDRLVIRPAALLCDSVAGGGDPRPIKWARIATLNDVVVPYRWNPFGQEEAPMVREGKVFRMKITFKETRPARRGYGKRTYRLTKRHRVFIGTDIVMA